MGKSPKTGQELEPERGTKSCGFWRAFIEKVYPIRYWVTAMLISRLLDTTTTYIGLKMGLSEANPAVAHLIVLYGPEIALTLTVGWLGVLIFFTEITVHATREWRNKHTRALRAISYGLVTVGSLLVGCWNMVLLIGQL